jgi:hypothetical protein
LSRQTWVCARATSSQAPGFDSGHLLVLDLWLPQPRFAKLADRVQFHDGVLARLGGTPGVRSAALVADLPLGNGRPRVPSRSPDPARASRSAGFNVPHRLLQTLKFVRETANSAPRTRRTRRRRS